MCVMFQRWPHYRQATREDCDSTAAVKIFNQERYLFGIAKKQAFITVIGREQHEAKRAFEKSNPASRVFADFTYRT